MSTMTTTQQRAAERLSQYFGYKLSEMTPVLDLRGGWVLFKTDHTYILSDGERCQSIDDHFDSASRHHLCRWNDSTKTFERI